MQFRIACAYSAAVMNFLVATPAFAQTDQTIVMTCSNNFPGQATYTLDLAARTMDELTVLPNAPYADIRVTSHGTITEISDKQIVWSSGSGADARTETLNRFTGDLTWVLLDPQRAADAARAGAATGMSCHRQQKQF